MPTESFLKQYVLVDPEAIKRLEEIESRPGVVLPRPEKDPLEEGRRMLAAYALRVKKTE